MPVKSHGWRSLVSYSPWGGKESDTNEQLHSLRGTNEIYTVFVFLITASTKYKFLRKTHGTPDIISHSLIGLKVYGPTVGF